MVNLLFPSVVKPGNNLNYCLRILIFHGFVLEISMKFCLKMNSGEDIPGLNGRFQASEKHLIIVVCLIWDAQVLFSRGTDLSGTHIPRGGGLIGQPVIRRS